MSSFEYYSGQWNVRCSMCGLTRKSGELVKNWQGQWRCPRHNEPRHPQDFVRTVSKETVPDFQQNPIDNDVGFCDPIEISAVAGGGVAGCAIAGYIYPSAREILADRDAAAAATHTWPL